MKVRIRIGVRGRVMIIIRVTTECSVFKQVRINGRT